MLDSAVLGQSGYSDLSAPLVEKNSEEARVRRQPIIRKNYLWFDRIFAVPFVFFVFITLVGKRNELHDTRGREYAQK